MIESLTIDHLPCFGPSAPPLQPLSQITFIYGPNGSGKSSIAKSLRAVKGQGFIQELFDKDFVELLLQPDHRMPGVFVIRDGDPVVQTRIDELVGKLANDGESRNAGEIEGAQKAVTQFEKSMDKQEQLVAKATEILTDACWKKRKALPQSFQEAFQGFLGDSKKNVAEVHNVRNTSSDDGVKSRDELLSSYQTLGDENTQELERFPLLSTLGEPTAERVGLLEKPIKSKDETSFGDFTRLLGNSDWVRQGLQYLEESSGQCPFCQQAVNDNISASLDQLFDHFYEDQIRVVREALLDEERRSEQIKEYISAIRTNSADETASVLKAAEAVQQRISTRRQQVESKIAAPSSRVVLQELEDLETDLKKVVSNANERIDEVNSLLRNRKLAKEALKTEVWRHYVYSVIDNDLSTYDGAIEAPAKALTSLSPKLKDAKQTLTERQRELSELQQQLTSAAPTVEAINRTLLNLGFLSFSIRHLDDDDTYQLVRTDGTPASHTLSEGERTLISFLYFFHKLLRLHENKSASEGLVAVIDDPVSSLDGEMLFVINLLLRKVFESCVKKTGRLKQVILLTHNAYFFKESEFTPKGVSPGDRSYMVLTKGATGTTSHRHYEKSPIKSNYTQLWDQVRAASTADNPELSAWLPNAMRRIVENYFQITGGLDTDKVIAGIPESDRWACQALLAWYNDGSHTAPWDVDYSSISSDATTHVRAFRQIFEASGHSAHYEMMMQE